MKVTKEMVRHQIRETTLLKNGQLMEITATRIAITIRRITRGGYFTNHPSSDSASSHIVRPTNTGLHSALQSQNTREHGHRIGEVSDEADADAAHDIGRVLRSDIQNDHTINPIYMLNCSLRSLLGSIE